MFFDRVTNVSPSPEIPRVWHLPPPGLRGGPPSRRVLMGQQGIFTASQELFAYELLFRAAGHDGLRVDLWEARRQDRATEHVIAAAFHRPGLAPPARTSFINFTRSFLVNRSTFGFSPDQAVIEIVESSYGDAALRHRLDELQSQGYRFAVDDFVATTSQIALLEHAEFVKIDARDLAIRGPELATLGRSRGAKLIAERVEDAQTFDYCRDLGFDLFQGYAFEHPQVIDRGEDPVP